MRSAGIQARINTNTPKHILKEIGTNSTTSFKNFQKFWDGIQELVNFSKQKDRTTQIVSWIANNPRYIDKIPKGSYLFHPRGKWKIRWDLSLGLLILYSIITVPYMLAFQIQHNSGLEGFELLIDALFLTDILLNFNTAYYDDVTEKLVTDRFLIATNYFKFWFYVDLFSSLPMDNILSGSATRSVRLIKTLRLMRLLKLTRFVKLGRISSHFEELEISPAFLNILKLLIQIFFVAHLVSCFWYMTSQIRWNNPAEVNWVDALGLLPTDASNFDKYVSALYWTIATIVAIGYGDFHPTNSQERLFSVGVMTVGGVMFGAVIAQVTRLIESRNPQARLFKEKMDTFKAYLSEKPLSSEIKMLAKESYAYYLQKKSSLIENEILDDLPHLLRVQLIHKIYEKDIKRIHYFSSCDPSYTAYLIRHSKPFEAKRDSLIASEGDVADEVIFVLRGTVNIRIRSGNQHILIGYVTEGHFFGDIEHATRSSCIASYYAESSCSLLSISNSIFDLAAEQFPRAAKQFRKLVHQRTQAFEETLRIEKQRHDAGVQKIKLKRKPRKNPYQRKSFTSESLPSLSAPSSKVTISNSVSMKKTSLDQKPPSFPPPTTPNSAKFAPIDSRNGTDTSIISIKSLEEIAGSGPLFTRCNNNSTDPIDDSRVDELGDIPLTLPKHFDQQSPVDPRISPTSISTSIKKFVSFSPSLSPKKHTHAVDSQEEKENTDEDIADSSPPPDPTSSRLSAYFTRQMSSRNLNDANFLSLGRGLSIFGLGSASRSGPSKAISYWVDGEVVQNNPFDQLHSSANHHGDLIRCLVVDQKPDSEQKIPLNSDPSKFYSLFNFFSGSSSSVSYKVVEESLENISRRFILHPQGDFKIRWDTLVGLLIIMSIFLIPVQVGFSTESVFGPPEASYFIDSIFLSDIILTLRTSYFSSNDDAWVIVPRLIVAKYLEGWFIVDFFSSVPLDKIIVSVLKTSSNGLKTLRLLKAARLTRLLKLARLIKLTKYVTRIEHMLGVSPAVFDLMKMICEVAFASHLIACIWFGVCNSISPPGSTWFDNLAFPVDTRSAPLRDKYIVSLYWTVTTLATVGYGDAFASNTKERILNIAIMMIGATSFGYIVANVSTLMGSLDRVKAENDIRISRITDFFKDKFIPKKLTNKVVKLIKHKHTEGSLLDEYDTLQKLPRQLSDRIILTINEDNMKIVPIFKYIPNQSIRVYIMNLLSFSYFEQGSYLVKEGEESHNIVYILSGKAKTIKRKTKEFKQQQDQLSFRVPNTPAEDRHRQRFPVHTPTEDESLADLLANIKKAAASGDSKKLIQEIEFFNKNRKFTEMQKRENEFDIEDDDSSLQNESVTMQTIDMVHKSSSSDDLDLELDLSSMAKKNTKDKIFLGELKEGDFAGHLSMMTGEPSPASVVALEYCTVLILSRNEIAKVLQHQPKIAKVLQFAIASSIQEMEKRLLREQVRKARYDFLHFLRTNYEEFRQKKIQKLQPKTLKQSGTILKNILVGVNNFMSKSSKGPTHLHLPPPASQSTSIPVNSSVSSVPPVSSVSPGPTPPTSSEPSLKELSSAQKHWKKLRTDFRIALVRMRAEQQDISKIRAYSIASDPSTNNDIENDLLPPPSSPSRRNRRNSLAQMIQSKGILAAIRAKAFVLTDSNMNYDSDEDLEKPIQSQPTTYPPPSSQPRLTNTNLPSLTKTAKSMRGSIFHKVHPSTSNLNSLTQNPVPVKMIRLPSASDVHFFRHHQTPQTSNQPPSDPHDELAALSHQFGHGISGAYRGRRQSFPSSDFKIWKNSRIKKSSV